MMNAVIGTTKTRRARGISFFVFFVPLWLFSSVCGFADDVGIDKARLIEEEPGEYLLEVDSAPRLAGAYRSPILPARFHMTGQAERERQAGYLIVRHRFRTSGRPLEAEDQILLPWNRIGVSLTAQWNDGSIHRNLFLREIEGIHVPVQMLKPVEERTIDVLRRNLQVGVTHAGSSWAHWVFILGICLIAKGWRLWRLVLLFAAGHGVSLIIADLGLPGVPLAIVELCLVVAALLAARAAWLHGEASWRFSPIVLILGIIHGVGYAGVPRESGAIETQLLPALLGFNLGVDVLHAVTACVLYVVALRFVRAVRGPPDPALSAGGQIGQALPPRSRFGLPCASLARLAVGSLAAAVLFAGLFGDGLSLALPHAQENQLTQFELPGLAGGASQKTGARPRPARRMTDPVMSYLTVELFEVRHEVLVSGQVANDWLEADLMADDVIQVEDQEAWKDETTRKVLDSIPVHIDGQAAEPITMRADFVTITANGISTRTTPAAEVLSTAVLGIVFVYETGDLAESVTVDWDVFFPDVPRVPATTTDPFGGSQQYVTAADPQVHWENRLAGYKVPEVKQVAFVKPTFPVVSVAFAALVALAYVLFSKRGHKPLANGSMSIGLAVVVVLYPFARTPVDLPFGQAWKPSTEQAASILDDLLTNLYRSFDLRDEEAIYDRLATSVTGDQLTKVYLENRRSLDLEDRGGARAKVDEVEILEVRNIRVDDSRGLVINAVWTVSGSVSHYGHTHYRRNRYDADVGIAPIDGAWRIRQIEVAEQQREL